MLPMQGARVQSLVGEVDPTCMLQLRVRMPQLRSPHATTKIPRAATKTQQSQNKEIFFLNKKIKIWVKAKRTLRRVSESLKNIGRDC